MKKVLGLCVLAVVILGCDGGGKAPTPQRSEDAQGVKGLVKGNPDTSCITQSNFYGKRKNLRKGRLRKVEDDGAPGRSTGEELDPSHPLYPVCVPAYGKATR